MDKHCLLFSDQVLEQLVQVISRLLGVTRLLFGFNVDERASKSIRVASGPFYTIISADSKTSGAKSSTYPSYQ